MSSNLANVLLDMLIEAKIVKSFGYPGGAVIPLFDEIYKHKCFENILVRHEQSAAHAAEAYGKVKKHIGVCIASSGPGATNLVTGIANAYMDSNPLLVITGQVNTKALNKNSFQEVDIVSIVKPITKKAIHLKESSQLPYVLADLLKTALSGRQGPVLLDLSKDLSTEIVDKNQLMKIFKEEYKTKITREENYQDSINELLNLLSKSYKPVFLIGAGIKKAMVEEEIERIIRYFKIPTVTSLHGLGVASSTPYYMGMAGMHGSVLANQALYNADLVISFGARFDDRIVGNKNKFAKDSIKVHIDIDPTNFNKLLKTDLNIHADLKDFMKLLYKEKINVNTQSWLLQLNNYKKYLEKEQIENNELIQPKEVFDNLDNNNNQNVIYVTDVGQHQMWSAQYLKTTSKDIFISSGSAGTMGFGLPAAIGAAIASPNALVILVVGDGGFQMNIQELILLKQYNLNIKILLFNNQRLGMVRQWQDIFFENRRSNTVLNCNPDFKYVARANSLYYLNIKNKQELKKINSVLKNKEPFIIEINIDPDANVLPMIPADQSFEEIIF
ncbi:biosynthetic-type acetolactate synthase large subunit [Mycoplasma sp. P36-A1]|uniref:biosynthetic-type acetolactate synthase large subunit n=1 Tax=Mycoplasma sp. P36-A1 TaxID=3252900 RepID=UPI003C2DE62C